MMLKQIWRRLLLFVVAWRKPKTAEADDANPQIRKSAELAPRAFPAGGYVMDETPPQTGEVLSIPVDRPNRHQRRAEAAWERERRKRDKFVTPQGPTPAPVARRAKRIAPASPTPVPSAGVEDAEYLIDGDDGLTYRENEFLGAFSFRDTILDQLDRYWVYLRRMRQHDRDSYEKYRQIGVVLVPPIHFGLHKGISHLDDDEPPDLRIRPLSPWWRAHRPSFGCIAYGTNSLTEEYELNPLKFLDKDSRMAEKVRREKDRQMYVPKFLYFTKYERPPADIKPVTGGDVYRMTIWWDRPQDPKRKNKHGTPQDYAVFISASGDDVHALPLRKTKMIEVPRKKNGLRKIYVPSRGWEIPDGYVQWAKEEGKDANTLLTQIFLDTAHSLEQAEAASMVRVTVRNGDLAAVFGIDIKRSAYFFQDRDVTLTHNGARQRIFHIVRPHVRSDGRAVKMHFRGLREFTWAGYNVLITVPGRDHSIPLEFEAGAVADADPKDKAFIHGEEVGRIMAENIRRGAH